MSDDHCYQKVSTTTMTGCFCSCQRLLSFSARHSPDASLYIYYLLINEGFPSATPDHHQPTSPDQLLTPTGSEHVFAPFSIPPNLEEIRQVFRLFDKNGDGSISPEELLNTMKCCGLEPTEHQINVLVSNADSTGSGTGLTVINAEIGNNVFLNVLFNTNPTQPELAFYLVGKQIDLRAALLTVFGGSTSRQDRKLIPVALDSY
eukprot:sb/3470508/